MGIPKIIHYCWFGTKELPPLEQKCISSWQKKLPDYKIVLWNESNFDITSVPYVREAYEEKKYAFVSDYVRIYALYKYGGIYFDTDVEVISNLDPFLGNEAFIGFENRTMVGTAVIGAQPKFQLIGEMLDYYKDRHFKDEKGILDTTTNVAVLNKLLVSKGMEPTNKRQAVFGLQIYERDFFCPKKVSEDEFKITTRSVTIHRFSGSWLSKREKKRGENILWINIARPTLKVMRSICVFILGDTLTKKIEVQLRNWMR